MSTKTLSKYKVMSKRNEGKPKGEYEQNVNMRLKEWLVLAKHGRFVEDFDVKELSRPTKVGGNPVPSDLNLLTLGELLQLQEMQTELDAMMVPCRVLFKMEDEEIMNARAVDVVRLASWVSREVKRIGDLFASCHNEPKPQEVKAGIHKLNFGVFGMIDWYARRMGIADHEEVERVPWVRVFKCMQMDSEMEAYNRRLNEVYRQENERRK